MAYHSSVSSLLSWSVIHFFWRAASKCWLRLFSNFKFSSEISNSRSRHNTLSLSLLSSEAYSGFPWEFATLLSVPSVLFFSYSITYSHASIFSVSSQFRDISESNSLVELSSKVPYRFSA